MLNQIQLRNSLILFNICLFLSYAFSLHIHPYRSYCNDVFAVLGLTLLIGYWACVPTVILRIPKIVIVPLIFIVVIAIQISNNFILYLADMTFPVVYFVCLGIAMTAGATVARQENGVATLCLTLACCFTGAGVLSVVLQHIQLADLDLMPWVVSLDWTAPLRPYANFAQANTLALTLCFAVASLWYLFILGRVKPAIAMGMAIIFLWGLALTQSRIAWVILPLFFLFAWMETRKQGKFIRYVLLILMILFVTFVMFAPVFLHMVGGQAASVESRAGQTGVRLVLWQQAMAMSMAHPWFGVGWFQFGPQQALSAVNFNPTEYSDYAHNLPLNLAAEIGWPLTLLFIAGSVLWIYQCCVRNWQNAHVRYASLIFIAVGVHSMVEFPLWYAFFLIPVGLLLGALQTEKLGWEEMRIGRGWLVGLVLFSIAAIVLVSLDYRRVARGFSAIALIQAGDSRYLDSIKKPELTLFPQYFDYFHIIEVQPGINMSPKDLEFLEQISMRFAFAPVLDRLAIAYSNNNRPKGAAHVLTIIQRIDTPEYAQMYAEWGVNAEKNPARYGPVFNHLLKPDTAPVEKN